MTPNEKDFSTQQQEAIQNSRLPDSNANDGRSERLEATTPQRKSQTRRLKGPSKSRFEQIFNTGTRVNGKFIRVCFLPGAGCLGIAVSRSTGCHAKRNRVRRRVRESWWTSEPPEGFDLVISAKSSAAEASFQDLLLDVKSVIQSIQR